MRWRVLAFPQAVEQLAAEAGLEMPQDTPEDRARQEKRKGLTEVNEMACAFFERTLRAPEGKAGLEYLRRRGLDDALIKKWRLGYAPDGRGALKAFMARGKRTGRIADRGWPAARAGQRLTL